jgi:hypothetical protein
MLFAPEERSAEETIESAATEVGSGSDASEKEKTKFETDEGTLKSDNPEFEPEEETLGSGEKGPFSKAMFNRWNEVMQDEEALEGLKSLGRLAGNTVLAGAEFVPGVGELPDWAAKGMKWLGLVNLTPDVNTLEDLGLEAVDLASGSLVPTRLIEGLHQAIVDYKEGRLQKGVDTLAYVITGKRNYTEELAENERDLDAAAGMWATPAATAGVAA